MADHSSSTPVMDPPMDSKYAELPLVAPGHTNESITEKISYMTLEKETPRAWWLTLLISLAMAGGLGMAILGLLFIGIGLWGPNVPVGWGMDIINFVWWIGIGHAGTLISAILLLFKQQWRNSINRFAEAMTLCAVLCALQYPLFHTGRPWLAWLWLLPYPNTMGIWPNFRSPLIWDVFAVSTYGTVSLLFWYVGMIPDLGTLRDRAKNQYLRMLYGMLAMGWRNSSRHWSNYEKAYLLLAGLSTPLVLSVHTVVSFDFSVSLLPGWHATIFPPYFVAGAVFAGFAMVLNLAIPMRWLYRLDDVITMRHIENMAKVMLATGLIVAYGYFMELFMAWYSGNFFEQFMMKNRITGPYWWSYWLLILCNVVIPNTLWSKKARTNTVWLFFVSAVVGVGMWLERFVIIVTSLYRDFMPSSWGWYQGTYVDWMFFIGTGGLFLMLMLLFVRFLPAIPMSEVKMILPGAEGRARTAKAGH